MSFHVFKNEQVRLSAESPPTTRRRRRRTVMTCMPCRLLKASCDRKAPCSRCVWRGKAAECTYCEFPLKTIPNEVDRSSKFNGLVEELGELDDSALPRCRADSTLLEYNKQGNERHQTKEGIEDDNGAKISDDTSLANKRAPPWYTPKSALRGATHWDGMLHQFHDLLPDDQESRRLLNEHLTHKPDQLDAADDVFPPPNFPFAGTSAVLSRDEVLTRLPPHDMCSSLVERYLSAVEGMHRFFHIPTFKDEFESFWESSTMFRDSWLAQLFVILALGYEATSLDERDPFIEHYGCLPSHIFLETAGSCLQKTTIMFRTDITLIRVLCLVVVAKLTGGYMCSIIDSCGPLTDMAVRGCIELGLNKPGGTSAVEKKIRERLWTAAVFLKVQQAANSGTPLLLHPSDFVAPITDYNGSGSIDSVCQWIIATSLPIAIDIVSTANSTSEGAIATDRMADHERNITKFLSYVHQIPDEPRAREKYGWCKLQKPMLHIWLRRLLLIIHQINNPFLLSRKGTEDSCQQYLGSALAILVCQRQLLEATERPTAMRILTSLFKQDFFIAAVGACVALRNSEPLHVQDRDDWARGLLATSTRGTIQDALHWCKELWERDIYRSTCNFWAYLILQRLTDGLSCRGERRLNAMSVSHMNG